MLSLMGPFSFISISHKLREEREVGRARLKQSFRVPVCY